MKAYAFSDDTRAFIENVPIPIAVYQYVDEQIRPLLVSRAYLVDRKSISYTNWWFKIFHLVLPMVDDRCLIDFIEIFVDTIN